MDEPEVLEGQEPELEEEASVAEPEPEPELEEEAEAEEVAPEDRIAALEAELSAARAKEKGLVAQVQRTRSVTSAKLSKLEKRFEDLNDLLAPLPEEELGPEPDRQEDPALWLDYQRRKDSLEASKKDAQRQAEEREQQEVVKEYQARNQRMAVAERDFLEEPGAPSVEDYTKAVKSLRDFRVKQLEAAGMERSEAEMYEAGEEQQLIQAAFDDGRNPAEIAFQMYREFQGVGSEKPQAPSKAKQQVQAVEKGVREGGLGTPGGSPKRTITMERVAAMSDEEYQEWRSKLSPGQWETFATTGSVSL
jgi:hypothetical protein